MTTFPQSLDVFRQWIVKVIWHAKLTGAQAKRTLAIGCGPYRLNLGDWLIVVGDQQRLACLNATQKARQVTLHVADADCGHVPIIVPCNDGSRENGPDSGR